MFDVFPRLVTIIACSLGTALGAAACGDDQERYVIVVTFRDPPDDGGLGIVADTLKSYGVTYDSPVALTTEIVRPPRITAELDAEADVCARAQADIASRADVASVTCEPAE